MRGNCKTSRLIATKYFNNANEESRFRRDQNSHVESNLSTYSKSIAMATLDVGM